jgi:hypothetical protein
MLPNFIARIVVFSTRYRWPVVSFALICGVIAAAYSVRYFSITTDINNLVAPRLAWLQNEKAFRQRFHNVPISFLWQTRPSNDFRRKTALALLSGHGRIIS